MESQVQMMVAKINCYRCLQLHVGILYQTIFKFWCMCTGESVWLCASLLRVVILHRPVFLTYRIPLERVFPLAILMHMRR